MKIGNTDFDFVNHAYIMGILNVTPDSFSDGGKYNSVDKALFHVEEMLSDGADMIDIGGESTRPGHKKITAEEEIHRLVPVIEAIKHRFDCVLSVDTYRAATWRAAREAGADLLNDVSGFLYDEDLAKTAAELDTPVIIMHSIPVEDEDNVVEEVLSGLRKSILMGLDAGLREDQIIVDPGIGFHKGLRGDLKMMNNLEALGILGYPVLLGTSRKRLIGNTLHLDVHERDSMTAVTTAVGLLKGCRIFRVHNVKENKNALDLVWAMHEEGKWKK